MDIRVRGVGHERRDQRVTSQRPKRDDKMRSRVHPGIALSTDESNVAGQNP